MAFKNPWALSHKPLFKKPNSRLPRFTAFAALASVFAFGVVTAFGIAPNTATQGIAITPVTTAVALPSFESPAAEQQTPFFSQGQVRRGDTVASLLARLGVDDSAALMYLKTDAAARPLYQLKPGRTVQASTDAAGTLLGLRYFNGQDSMLVVERHASGLQTKEQPLAQTRRVILKAATVRNSLFGASDAAGIPDNIAQQIASIFSTDIDFHQDLRRGDQFSVAYEAFYEGGELVHTGRLLAAEFTSQGHTYRAVYHENGDGEGSYFTPDGKNLRKAFLRSPLEYSRITSGFTQSRFHPVLKTWRAHKGVDFAAPTGTRVLATADGVVAEIGRKGGYGNVVVLQHSDQYSTVYGHLSAFKGGLRRGAKVRQGEVIAYVGATGWATGPHLHYEFKVAGEHRNPLGASVPVAFPMPPREYPAFAQSARLMVGKLDLVRGTNLNSFE